MTGRGADVPEIGPSFVLSVLLGIFWTAAAVLVRGAGGARLPFLLLLAITGTWAGDAVGGRIGGPFDLLRIGDFRPLAASVGAICGIALVVVVSVLGPTRPEPGPPGSER
jgi:CDP-diglyceride synthetase